MAASDINPLTHWGKREDVCIVTRHLSSTTPDRAFLDASHSETGVRFAQMTSITTLASLRSQTCQRRNFSHLRSRRTNSMMIAASVSSCEVFWEQACIVKNENDSTWSLSPQTTLRWMMWLWTMDTIQLRMRMNSFSWARHVSTQNRNMISVANVVSSARHQWVRLSVLWIPFWLSMKARVRVYCRCYVGAVLKRNRLYDAMELYFCRWWRPQPTHGFSLKRV